MTGVLHLQSALPFPVSLCALWRSGKGRGPQIGTVDVYLFPRVDAAVCISLSEALRNEVAFGYAAACAGGDTPWNCMLLSNIRIAHVDATAAAAIPKRHHHC